MMVYDFDDVTGEETLVVVENVVIDERQLKTTFVVEFFQGDVIEEDFGARVNVAVGEEFGRFDAEREIGARDIEVREDSDFG